MKKKFNNEININELKKYLHGNQIKKKTPKHIKKAILNSRELGLLPFTHFLETF